MDTYLLDANIIIKLWNEAPDVLDAVEADANIDFRITNNVALELIKGEQDQFFPKMAPKYQKLIKHMVNAPGQFPDKPYKENRFLEEIDGKLTVVIGNKVSSVDYLMILTCQNEHSYKLVTEDAKMLKSSNLVLDESRILNYNEFITDLILRGVISESQT